MQSLRPSLSRASRREEMAGYLFVAPAVLLIFCLVIVPIFVSFYISFTDYNIIKTPVWKGLDNYIRVFTSDRRLGRIYANTFSYTAMAVVGNVGLGLLLAVFLNQKFPSALKTAFRFSFFLPVIIAYVYVSIVWRAMYATDTGIFNYLLEQIGISKVGWLTNKNLALFSIIVMDNWKNAGYFMIIFLAGLQGIAPQYYEAARIDGANSFRIFTRITLPMLTPTIFFNLTWSSINAMQAFDSMSILTEGGPGDASRGIVMYIYETGFEGGKFGYASALAVTLFVIVATITFFQFKFSERWVHY